MGEEHDAALAGVAREVNKDVDAVSTHPLGGKLVAQCRDVSPSLRHPANVARHLVLKGNVRIAEYLEASPIMRSQHRLDERRDRMALEIAGHVADVEASLGRALARCARRLVPDASRMPLRPFNMLAEQ